MGPFCSSLIALFTGVFRLLLLGTNAPFLGEFQGVLTYVYVYVHVIVFWCSLLATTTCTVHWLICLLFLFCTGSRSDIFNVEWARVGTETVRQPLSSPSPHPREERKRPAAGALLHHLQGENKVSYVHSNFAVHRVSWTSIYMYMYMYMHVSSSSVHTCMYMYMYRYLNVEWYMPKT